MFGLILHDIPEGFAMANAHIASPSLRLLVSLAIALHNLPDGFAMSFVSFHELIPMARTPRTSCPASL
jgi:zinc transporter ZupT